MTQNILTIQFYRLIVRENPLEKMKTIFDASIKSGVINMTDEPEDSFRLPAIIYHAILSEMVLRVKPKEEADLMESENLQRFL